MKAKIFLLLLLFCGLMMSPGRAGEGWFKQFGAAADPLAAPLTARASLAVRADYVELTLHLDIRSDTHLYAEQTFPELPGGAHAELSGGDKPTKHGDDPSPVYVGKVRLLYKLPADTARRLDFELVYQGCSGTMCFLPRRLPLTATLPDKTGTPVSAGREIPAAAPAATATPSPAKNPIALWQELTDRFTVARTTVGYQDAETFSVWLRGESRGGVMAFLDGVLENYGLWIVALLLLPLGALLNLTPCVLPMVPITLAVLGATKTADGKGRGFLLGTLYGLGMALVYGILGLAVVLTGSRFGALNSSPWFNFTMAAVFVALALAMFDVWMLDFTCYNKIKVDNKQSPFWGAFLLGGVTALLAGACVAPVLVWVLLLAADLYRDGNAVGIMLPFLLGVGLGLPWPFLAAGVSRLPKPGSWMKRVKQGFGALILLVAAYYAWLGYRLLTEKNSEGAPTENAADALPGWHNDLITALQAAETSGKPLLIDFSGIACKACAAMKATTLRRPEVTAELEKMEKVEFLADGGDAFTAAVVKRFGVVGLPTYVILEKKK